MNKKWTIVLAALICLALAGIVWAQTSSNYDNSWHVLGAGGGQSSSSAGHTVRGTTGQFAIGPASSSQTTLGAGYWYGVRARLACEEVTGVDFGWQPLTPQTGQLVTLTASIQPPSATLPISYSWSLGDGGGADGNPIYHTYVASGTYTVYVTATNECGGPVWMSHSLTVTGQPFTPTYGVELSPETDSGSGEPGQSLVYTLTVHNTGDVADSFDLSYADNSGWTRDLDPDSVNLPPDGSTPVWITVDIPAGAGDGDYDAVTVTVTSQGDPAVHDHSTLTTTAVCQPVDILSVSTNIDGCLVDFEPDYTGTPTFTWDWQFQGGNPATSSQENPSGIDFGLSGTYAYTVSANNCAGVPDTYTGQVTVTCPPPSAIYTLTLYLVGNGSVVPDPSGTLLLPRVWLYEQGAVVSLTATPDAGWQFDGWSGDLSGSANPEQVTMDASQTITATFSETTGVPTYTLTVDVLPAGSGSVSLDPAGGVYDEGTVVELSAMPDTGWAFSAWSGDLSGSINPITITMDTDHSVTANFTQTTRYIYLPIVTRNH